MVANGINRGELVSRVREFLRGLSREDIKQLSHKEFARAISADLLSITCEHKWELARIINSIKQYAEKFEELEEKTREKN
jgi:uncharacterized protein YdaT